jgi:hypothetical protein
MLTIAHEWTLVIRKEYNNNQQACWRGQGLQLLLLQLQIVKTSGKQQNEDAADNDNKKHARFKGKVMSALDCVARFDESRADLIPKNGKNFNIDTFK